MEETDVDDEPIEIDLLLAKQHSLKSTITEEEIEIPHKPTGEEISQYLEMINPPKSPGRFQIILFVTVSLFFSAATGVGTQAVYYGYTPSHHCNVDNMSHIPEDFDATEGINVPSSCSMYSNLTSNGTNVTLEVVSCQNGWTYDRTEFGQTFVTEFDLVCARSSYFETIMTISSVVCGISTPIQSYLTDRFGRRKVFIIIFTIERILSFGYAVFPTLPLVSTAFIISSIGYAGSIPILIMYESLPERYRGLSGTMLNLIHMVIMGFFPLTGWLIHEWRILIIIWNTFAAVVGVVGYWLIPESLTWLLSNGRVAEAEKLMQKIAKFNKINLPQPALKNELFEPKKKENGDDDKLDAAVAGTGCCAVGIGNDIKLKTEKSKKKIEKSEKSSIRELIRSKTMIKITCIISGTYLVNNIANGGLSYIAPYLHGNMHLNNFLMIIVELPAYIVTVYAVERFGRKRPTIGFMLIGGIGLLLSLTEFIKFEVEQTWIPIVTASIGKFGISGSYAIIYLYGPELFPTNVRSTGMAVCSVSELIGSMIVPYTSIYLVKIATWIPRVLYGFLAIVMAIPIFLLPETKGKPLPETVKEIEEW